jgi:4-amino-4-deoxy-L-arabinose transferase-like glycosyltransferase
MYRVAPSGRNPTYRTKTQSNMKPPNKKEKKQAGKPKAFGDKESVLTEFFKNPFFSSKAFEILLFFFILGLAFLGGVLFLSADPPAISWSQDVGTDPPQYTHYARNEILWGSWEPFGPNRFVFFMKSFTTLFSYLVFSLFGMGRFQANLVAVLFNLLSLVFFFLALKKIFSKRMAFLSLFFLGINYVFIMYGRNPFLEISANFLLILGFYFMVSSFKRELLLIPSGICFATGIFFGKTMAAFILPACLAVLLFWTFEHYSSSNRSGDRPAGGKMNFKPLFLFGAGFIVISVFWLFFSYLPAKREVVGYLSEQALGLYGFPRALESIPGFINSLFTFGEDLFYRMPVVFLLSFLGLLLFFLYRPSIKELIRQKDSESKVKLFLVLWFLVGFFLLMVLNYRPLRYQFYLIVPLCAFSGLWLDSFLRSSGFRKPTRLGILFWVFFVVAGTFFVNYTILTIYSLSRKTIQLASSLGISFALTLFCGVLFYWRFVRDKAGNSRRTELKLAVMLILILTSFLVSVWQYGSWASSRTYSLNRSSVDLGKILNEEAVVSGPYGPGLVWDNKLKNVIHMFGVTKPDPKLFLTYPITHLALERGGNRDRAFKDYPEVMNKAKIVTTYWLRNILVDIYRIAEWTGNPKTEKYHVSDFEKAKMLIEKGDTTSAVTLLEEFVSRQPQNLSGYQALAEIYYNLGEIDKSALFLEKAREFNPTDFFIHQQLGMVYLALENQTREDRYRLKAIEEWEKSLKFFPGNANLAAQLQQIKGY